MALMIASLPVMVGIWVAGSVATQDAHSNNADLPYLFCGEVAALSMIATAVAIHLSVDPLRQNAIRLYNASPPPGCGPPAGPTSPPP